MSTTSYLDTTAADALATEIPALAAWAAATNGDKSRALAQASADVDSAMPYQGHRYDLAQALEFPRIAYDAPIDPANRAFTPNGLAEVWDWDPSSNAPIVPLNVQLAVLYQADSILAGQRESRISAELDGVVYQLTGALAESYKQSPGTGVRTGLCRRAWMLMRNYRRRSGVLL